MYERGERMKITHRKVVRSLDAIKAEINDIMINDYPPNSHSACRYEGHNLGIQLVGISYIANHMIDEFKEWDAAHVVVRMINSDRSKGNADYRDYEIEKNTGSYVLQTEKSMAVIETKQSEYIGAIYELYHDEQLCGIEMHLYYPYDDVKEVDEFVENICQGLGIQKPEMIVEFDGEMNLKLDEDYIERGLRMT